MNKINCENCKSVMLKNTNEVITLPSELLISNKNYGNNFAETALQPPSDYLFQICVPYFTICNDFIKNQMHLSPLKATIVKACIRTTNINNPEWFCEENPCFLHQKALLDFLILVTLRKNCLWLSLKTADSKAKLKILKS